VEFTSKEIDQQEAQAEADYDRHTQVIGEMTHFEMAQLWRFAPAGHPYFVSGSPLTEAFVERFNQLGGMTSKLSKQVGWKE
jgi:hypothetical protein